MTSALLIHCWPTQPKKCASLTDLVGGGFWEQFSVPSVCEGVRFIEARVKSNLKIKNKNLYTLYVVYLKPKQVSQYKFASILVEFQFLSKFG